MSDQIEIITSEDGSHTLWNPVLQETYHSTHGAIQESQHVFIKEGLQFFTENNPDRSTVNILEVGFGTGLNVLLTTLFSRNNNTIINLDSYETRPLPKDIWSQINYPELLKSTSPKAPDIYNTLHELEWNIPIEIEPGFYVRKCLKEIQSLSDQEKYHIVYFDAFAPGKQEEMWDEMVFQKIYDSMAIGGILVTYCAQGKFKRTLKSIGFEVESRIGPPGKKEMTRAFKK